MIRPARSRRPVGAYSARSVLVGGGADAEHVQKHAAVLGVLGERGDHALGLASGVVAQIVQVVVGDVGGLGQGGLLEAAPEDHRFRADGPGVAGIGAVGGAVPAKDKPTLNMARAGRQGGRREIGYPGRVRRAASAWPAAWWGPAGAAAGAGGAGAGAGWAAPGCGWGSGRPRASAGGAAAGRPIRPRPLPTPGPHRWSAPSPC